MFDKAEFTKKSESLLGENRVFIKKLSKMDSRRLDELAHAIHEEVFEEINCLECANCCSSLGPGVTAKDVERISRSLRMKPFLVESTYLKRDEEGDLIFRSMPCPFLDKDNYCRVYEDRPKACREYPHTDRKKFNQLLPLTLKNSLVCPAVLEIIERLKSVV